MPYEVRDAAGVRMAEGLTGRSVDLPEGVYTVVVHTPGKPLKISPVRVALRGATTIELRREGQEIGVTVTPRAGSD